jgi:hypothetical protein
VTNLYAVVGEHHADPNHVLVLGEDGQYYDWDLIAEQTRPVEPGDEWHLDVERPAEDVAFEEVFLNL